MTEQPDLFPAAFQPCEWTRAVVRDGINHWRTQIRRYGACWPYLVPYWQAMIDWNRRILAEGFEAAGPKPEQPGDAA